MPGDLPARVDRLRSRALRATLAALSTVDPDRLTATWPDASAAIVAAVARAQDDTVAAVTDHLGTTQDQVIGAQLGWDLAGLVAGTVAIPRLAARLAATPRLVDARVAAGATPAEAVAATATFATQVAGTVAHQTARHGIATGTTALTGYSGWRWIPETGACDWCRMQSTRGATHASGPEPNSHRHCRCELKEVTDPVEAQRVADEGRVEWERMKLTGEVPTRSRRGRARSQGLPKPGADASRVRPGARTPERLASVRAQIASYERKPATPGTPAREWQDKKLTELRAEERRLAESGSGSGGRLPPTGRRAAGVPDDPDDYRPNDLGERPPWKPSERPKATVSDLHYILDGDPAMRRGGHRHGTGIPGKTEFPEGWGEAEVEAAIDDALLRPQRITHPSRYRWEFLGLYRGELTLVVVDARHGTTRIVTAFPPPRI